MKARYARPAGSGPRFAQGRRTELVEGVKRAAETLLWSPEFRSTVVILGKDLTVVATRQFRIDRRNNRETFVVTVGRPNYVNRKRITKLVKEKASFPLDLVYPWPRKR